MKTALFASIAAGVAIIATPAMADPEIVVTRDALPVANNSDTNKFWLDFKTDVSEAKRELAEDLERATDAEDRREARAEYLIEVEDAKQDYTEEMLERGYYVANFREDGVDVTLLF